MVSSVVLDVWFSGDQSMKSRPIRVLTLLQIVSSQLQLQRNAAALLRLVHYRQASKLACNWPLSHTMVNN